MKSNPQTPTKTNERSMTQTPKTSSGYREKKTVNSIELGSLHDRENLSQEIILLKRERNDLKEEKKLLKTKLVHLNQQLNRMAQIVQADDSPNGKNTNAGYREIKNNKNRDDSQKSKSLAFCIEELEKANQEIAKLKQQNTELRERIQMSNKMLKERVEKLNNGKQKEDTKELLKETKAKYKKKIKSLKDSTNEIEKRWKDEKLGAGSLKDEINIIKDQTATQLKTCEEKLQILNTTIEEKNASIDSLKKEMDQCKTTVSNLQKEKEDLLQKHQNEVVPQNGSPKHDIWHNDSQLLVVIDAAGVGSSKDIEVTVQGTQMSVTWSVGSFEKKNLLDKFIPLTFNRIHPEKILQAVTLNLTLPTEVDKERKNIYVDLGTIFVTLNKL